MFILWLIATAHHRQITISRNFSWPKLNFLTFPGSPCFPPKTELLCEQLLREFLWARIPDSLLSSGNSVKTQNGKQWMIKPIKLSIISKNCQQYLCVHVRIKCSFCNEPNFQYVEYIKIQLPVNSPEIRFFQCAAYTLVFIKNNIYNTVKQWEIKTLKTIFVQCTVNKISLVNTAVLEGNSKLCILEWVRYGVLHSGGIRWWRGRMGLYLSALNNCHWLEHWNINTKL